MLSYSDVLPSPSHGKLPNGFGAGLPLSNACTFATVERSGSDADQRSVARCFDGGFSPLYNGSQHVKNLTSKKVVQDTRRCPSPVLLSKSDAPPSVLSDFPYRSLPIKKHPFHKVLPSSVASFEPPKKRYLRTSALQVVALSTNADCQENSAPNENVPCDPASSLLSSKPERRRSPAPSEHPCDGTTNHVTVEEAKKDATDSPVQADRNEENDFDRRPQPNTVEEAKTPNGNQNRAKASAKATHSLIISDPNKSPRIILFCDGLFYPGTLQPFDPFNLYTFVADEKSAKEPYYLCLEEVLNRGLKERIPKSADDVPPDTRICALRNREMIGFAPGTVKSDGGHKRGAIVKRGTSPKVSINFDDGDTGKIALCDIRLLPPGFRSDRYVVGVQSYVLPEFISRKRSSVSSVESNASDSLKTKVAKRSRATKVVHYRNKPIWKWCGPPAYRVQRSRKRYYQAAQRKDEIIQVGDCVEFYTTPKGKQPYVGVIQKLWSSSSRRRVLVAWCYRATEIDVDTAIPFRENALYSSEHEDVNEVTTISHKCLLLSLEQFRKRMLNEKPMEDVFYLAGSYDHVNRVITDSFID